MMHIIYITVYWVIYLPDLPYKRYTDDTAMTFALCRSLLEKNALDLPNLAKHFAQEFIKDHRR